MTFTIPQKPPEPVKGVPGPTFVGYAGNVWRRSYDGWFHMDEPMARLVLAGFRKDATDTSDWFHARANELADELETALSAIQPMERAA